MEDWQNFCLSKSEHQKDWLVSKACMNLNILGKAGRLVPSLDFRLQQRTRLRSNLSMNHAFPTL
jgi:hypothetical protein